LSKAPVPSALLKTRRIVVEYSHNNWYTKRGQAKVAVFSIVISGLDGLANENPSKVKHLTWAFPEFS